jgi:hypothetical protein
MKHLLITSAILLAFFIGISKTKSITKDIDYVVTEKGIFLPEDVSDALREKFYTDHNGETLKLKLSDIKSVIINGKEYSF